MKPNPIHIFKSGTHAPMTGGALSFSESDLEATARAYDPALHEAPLVIGHPKADAPAYGWVQSLGISNGGLAATPHQIDPAFAELVRDGKFKKVSASFYRPDSPNNPVPGVWYLRHVGFLGAQPPAVKGLKPVEFSDNDADVVEFADYADGLVARMFRSLRELVIEKFGADAADRAVPDYAISALEDEARREDPEDAAPAPAFSDPATPNQPSHKEIHAVTPEEKARLEAENAQLKQQLAERDARDKAAQATKRHQDNANFAEQLVGGGKLAPKHKGAVVALLDLAAKPADDGQVVEFGEGDGKQPLVEAVKGFLGDMPKVVDFGESATKDRAAGDKETNPLLADAESRAGKQN